MSDLLSRYIIILYSLFNLEPCKGMFNQNSNCTKTVLIHFYRSSGGTARQLC